MAGNRAAIRPLLWLTHKVRESGKVRTGRGPFPETSIAYAPLIRQAPRIAPGEGTGPGGAPPYGGRAACRGPFPETSIAYAPLIRQAIRRKARRPKTEPRIMCA